MGLLEEHRVYLSDAPRLRAFRRALSTAVRPGAVVLDLGAGTGILGLLALRAGAGRVHAVDEGPVLEVAREAIRAAGFEDRWVGVRGLSMEVDLPEKADLLVADHVGGLGLDYGILAAYADARARHLKRGARVIPETVEIHLALVSSPRLHGRVAFWKGGLARRLAANTPTNADVRRRELASAPARAVTVDLRTAPDGSFEGRVVLRASRAGAVHGLVGFFRSRLAPGIWMTNSPFSAAAIQRSPVFLPLEGPLRVARGQEVKVTLRLRPAEGLVTWSAGDSLQSSFLGQALAAEDLRRLRPDHRPALTPRGEALARVLDLCRRGLSVATIRGDLRRRFPRLFPDGEQAAAFVAAALERAAR